MLALEAELWLILDPLFPAQGLGQPPVEVPRQPWTQVQGEIGDCQSGHTRW